MIRPAKVILLVFLVVISFLGGVWYNKQQAVNKNISARGRRILYYVDPMNPAHTSTQPGIAPCGMKMEPVYADGSTDRTPGTTTSVSPGTVKISPEKQQIIGVQVALVEKKPWTPVIRTLGRVAADETRLFRVNAAIDGWIREVFLNSTGSLVSKNQPLATFYSRDLLTAQQAYFYALNTQDRLKESDLDNPSQHAITSDQVRSNRENLENLGIGAPQLQEITRTRQAAQEITIFAPTTGFVLVRNVSPGQRFQRGDELYRIADLSHVWILADLFENEEQYVRPGVTVRVSLPYQGKVFHATVSKILPQFDAASRTLKVRLETDNPGYAFRPDMLVDVEIPVNMPPAITIPMEALIESGLDKTVFVDRSNGFFEPRQVQTGRRLGGRIEIVNGLMDGERVVVSGSFLLNSESRMKLAAAGIYGPPSKDLVCGMTVDTNKARATGRTSEYHGKTYYFCNDECKRQFDKHPDHYLK